MFPDAPSTEPVNSRALQRAFGFLRTLYCEETAHVASDFLCDAATAVRLAGSDVVRRREVLLVVQRSEDTEVALYLDPTALDRLGAQETVFSFACAQESALVVEGASHLLYVLARDERGESVSQLELELQAEVDKFAAALLAGDGAEEWLMGNGVGLFRARQRSGSIRKHLFQGVRFLDQKGSEAGDRYREAHHMAERYTAYLERRLVADPKTLQNELRRFFSMNQRQKIERIAAL